MEAYVRETVVMTPMGTGIAAPNGGVNDDIIAYYEARAKGGVGLIESELCRVLDGAGAGLPCQLAARNFADVAGLARLVDTVHKYGAKIFFQLQHPGGQGSSAIGGEPIVAASAVKAPTSTEIPHALEVNEIARIESAFVSGAMITKMAGADGVLLHGAHGYLINSFLSTYLNKRTEDYGGNLTNRMRFLVEIIRGIRQQCGDFPLGVRLSVEEFLGTEGNDLEESCRICETLEGVGVDFIDVSCTIPGSPEVCACIEPGTYGEGWKRYMAAEVKKHVNIPVIAVCNIKEPDVQYYRRGKRKGYDC
jgi:2,4-dienoyl-CoA reductase-like NADH-dependent reductase (Old Yellow Enzyme family)